MDENTSPDRDADRRIAFLSYRRTDDRYLPGRLAHELAGEFGRDNIFLDVDSIFGGEDFVVSIPEYIAKVDVMLALIGQNWEPSRLAEVNDWVRMELVAALAQHKPIIPVLIDDTAMPTVDQLPTELRKLVDIQALRVRPDPDFEVDAHRLVDTVRRHHQRAAAIREQEEARRKEEDAEAEMERAAEAEAAARAAEAEAAARAAAEQLRTEQEPAAKQDARRRDSKHIDRRSRDEHRRRIRLVAAVGVAFVLLAVVVLLAVNKDNKPLTTLRVQVDSRVAWTDAGVDVTQQDRIEVSAGGSIQHATPDPDSTTGPDGDPRPELRVYNRVVEGGPMAGAHAGLIGRVGNDVIFLGSHYTYANPASTGRLYLGVNDEGLENNAGSFFVVLSITGG